MEIAESLGREEFGRIEWDLAAQDEGNAIESRELERLVIQQFDGMKAKDANVCALRLYSDENMCEYSPEEQALFLSISSQNNFRI